MKGALPLSRLKVKEKIENESRSIIDKTTSDNIYFDIEKILIDRQRNKKREFFVKWKEQPESENSWVPEENFQNSSVIKDYFKNKRQLKKGNKIQTEVIEINKPSFNNNQITINKTTKWKDMQIFLQLLLIFTTLEFTNTTIISDDFNFCQSMSNMPTLDIDNLCNFNIVKQEQLIPTSNSTTLLILSKLHNIVNGIGYECSKTVTSRYLQQNIFGFKSIIKQTTSIISLTPEDCQYMLYTKKCENKQMYCEGKICHLSIVSEQSYVYYTTVIAKDYFCQIKPLLITAESVDTILFGQTNEKCTATKLFCKLSESTIIWSTDIIHDCPFEIVLNDNFTIEENNIVINETFQILLKIIEKTNWCAQNMYSTTERLYIIAYPNNNSNLLEKLNFNTGKLSELTTINDLILTDTDFKSRQLLVIDKIFNQNLCKLQQSIIRSFKSHIDTYHIIQLKNKPMIIYSTGQNVYIPT
jgi:hypothetical protein